MFSMFSMCSKSRPVQQPKQLPPIFLPDNISLSDDSRRLDIFVRSAAEQYNEMKEPKPSQRFKLLDYKNHKSHNVVTSLTIDFHHDIVAIRICDSKLADRLNISSSIYLFQDSKDDLSNIVQKFDELYQLTIKTKKTSGTFMKLLDRFGSMTDEIVEHALVKGIDDRELKDRVLPKISSWLAMEVEQLKMMILDAPIEANRERVALMPAGRP